MMAKLTFNRRPMPIFAEYRPLYKISIILMILYFSSRGKKSSLIRLQLFNWAIKNEKRKSLLLVSVTKGSLHTEVWGMDPTLNISLQFALAEKLIDRSGTTYSLTNKGKQFLDKVIDENCLKVELEFFKKIGAGLTESMINDGISRWN